MGQMDQPGTPPQRKDQDDNPIMHWVVPCDQLGTPPPRRKDQDNNPIMHWAVTCDQPGTPGTPSPPPDGPAGVPPPQKYSQKWSRKRTPPQKWSHGSDHGRGPPPPKGTRGGPRPRRLGKRAVCLRKKAALFISEFR